jgi:2-polyprenyl-3-methyl-5-hydroxy-6-metoxy-1,4-benzoquinol methylase
MTAMLRVEGRTTGANPSIDAQQKFWNDHWQRWHQRKVINSWSISRAERILELLRCLSIQDANILDLGCGIGWFTEKLTSFGHVTGIDLSEDAIAAAKARCPHIKFVAGNILDNKLPKEHFDVTVSQEVLAHVEDQSRYLSTAAELLKPGGYLILTTANRFVLEHLGAVTMNAFPPEHIECFLSARQLKRLLRPHFRVLGIRSTFPLGNGGILRIINSYKLNAVLGSIISQHYLESVKEWAGLGYSLFALAQKPN